MGQRFWDPDAEINDDLFKALEDRLFQSTEYTPTGININDATLIKQPGVIYVAANAAGTGLRLPNVYGIFIVGIEEMVNTFFIYPPTVNARFLNAIPGDPIGAGPGEFVAGIIVRISDLVWALVGKV